MTRFDAERVLAESLARPSATPCTWREDRDAYIREEQAKLRSCLIEPVEVEAVASQWAQQYCNQSNAIRRFFALAHADGKWLLYDSSQSEFALAYGESLITGPLSLLGFSSPDALAEWLG